MAGNPLIPFGFGASDPIFSLHREMNRLFDDVFRSGGRALTQERASTQPAFFNASMNVSETDKEVKVTVELPGVTEQDVDVTLDADVLTIRGEKKSEAERGGEKESFHWIERSYGSFQRSLRLPYAVNPDEVQASFDNGVLTVTVPKSTQQERSRKIQIQGTASPGGQQAQVGQGGSGGQKGTIGNGGGGATSGGGPTSGGDQQPAAH
jgi:HSP20 family protein